VFSARKPIAIFKFIGFDYILLISVALYQRFINNYSNLKAKKFDSEKTNVKVESQN
jgi:hypothetical protein